MTAMFLAEEEGQKLNEKQVVMTTMIFLTAGFESTNNLFTTLTYALSTHPTLYEALKQNQPLVPGFVKEGMRCDSTVQGFVHSPQHDFCVGGPLARSI